MFGKISFMFSVIIILHFVAEICASDKFMELFFIQIKARYSQWDIKSLDTCMRFMVTCSSSKMVYLHMFFRFGK